MVERLEERKRFFTVHFAVVGINNINNFEFMYALSGLDYHYY